MIERPLVCVSALLILMIKNVPNVCKNFNNLENNILVKINKFSNLASFVGQFSFDIIITENIKQILTTQISYKMRIESVKLLNFWNTLKIMQLITKLTKKKLKILDTGSNLHKDYYNCGF